MCNTEPDLQSNTVSETHSSQHQNLVQQSTKPQNVQQSSNLESTISTLPTQSNVNKLPTIATKANKRKQESEQKQYIISLEKQVKEHEKTIQLLQKNLDALAKNIDQNNSTTVQDDPRPQSGQFGSISDLEVRIRQLEMQNMQNLCIFTALTSTLTMQQANSQSRGGMPIFPHSVYPQYPHIAGTTIPINPFQYATMQPPIATMQPPIVPLVNPLGQTMGYPPQAVPMARVPPPPPYHNHVFVQNPIPVVPQPPPSPANQNIAHNIPLQTYKLPTGNHSQSQKLPPQMSQNGGTQVPPQYSSQPHPEPYAAHTHHCEPPTDPIMEYEPTPSNIPDQRVELSPQRHGHIHLPEAEPVQQGQEHISRSALNGNLRLSQEQQKKRPVNDRNATNGSMVQKSAIQCRNEGGVQQPKIGRTEASQRTPSNDTVVMTSKPGKQNEANIPVQNAVPTPSENLQHRNIVQNKENTTPNSFLCIPGLQIRPPDKTLLSHQRTH